MLLNILLSLLVLNIMVIAHEFGHYLLARKNGIFVDEFAIGFGPTLLKKKWMGTMWMIKAFPLGGYNGLKGETAAEPGKGNFSTASKKAKFQVLIAGSLMNVFLAVVAFYIALALYGWKTPVPIKFTPIGATFTVVGSEKQTQYGAEHPMVTAVLKDSPISRANIKLPFSILVINNVVTKTPQDVIDSIKNAQSDVLELIVQDADGNSSTISVTKGTDGKIGINMVSAPVQLDYSTKLSHKIFAGFSHTINMTVLTWKMLSSMISYSIRSKDLEPIGYAFAGPVAIVAAVGSVVDNSKTVVADLANMTGLIGISLAMFNILPFPGLDGWHILLLFYEKARGKKANEKLVNIVTAVGLFFLIGLGIIIMFKDVWLFFLRK